MIRMVDKVIINNDKNVNWLLIWLNIVNCLSIELTFFYFIFLLKDFWCYLNWKKKVKRLSTNPFQQYIFLKNWWISFIIVNVYKFLLCFNFKSNVIILNGSEENIYLQQNLVKCKFYILTRFQCWTYSKCSHLWSTYWSLALNPQFACRDNLGIQIL